jgi:hypothetical protein
MSMEIVSTHNPSTIPTNMVMSPPVMLSDVQVKVCGLLKRLTAPIADQERLSLYLPTVTPLYDKSLGEKIREEYLMKVYSLAPNVWFSDHITNETSSLYQNFFLNRAVVGESLSDFERKQLVWHILPLVRQGDLIKKI